MLPSARCFPESDTPLSQMLPSASSSVLMTWLVASGCVKKRAFENHLELLHKDVMGFRVQGSLHHHKRMYLWPVRRDGRDSRGVVESLCHNVCLTNPLELWPSLCSPNAARGIFIFFLIFNIYYFKMLCTGLAQQYPFNKCELSFLKGTQASICYRARSLRPSPIQWVIYSSFLKLFLST